MSVCRLMVDFFVLAINRLLLDNLKILGIYNFKLFKASILVEK